MTDPLPNWVNPTPAFLAALAEEQRFVDMVENDDHCHCGHPVAYGYDGDPSHHRGMCEHCDSVRCDAYPGGCGR